jgi:hypothetical protein
LIHGTLAFGILDFKTADLLQTAMTGTSMAGVCLGCLIAAGATRDHSVRGGFIRQIAG